MDAEESTLANAFAVDNLHVDDGRCASGHSDSFRVAAGRRTLRCVLAARVAARGLGRTIGRDLDLGEKTIMVRTPNAEFIRFLRYANRSCTEVQSELYVALDEEYVTKTEFEDVYEQARDTRAAIRGFINYLKKHETRKAKPTAEP